MQQTNQLVYKYVSWVLLGLAILVALTPTPTSLRYLPILLLSALAALTTSRRARTATGSIRTGWALITALPASILLVRIASHFENPNQPGLLHPVAALFFAAAVAMLSLAVGLLVRPSPTQFMRRGTDTVTVGLAITTALWVSHTGVVQIGDGSYGNGLLHAMSQTTATHTATLLFTIVICCAGLAKSAITVIHRHLRTTPCLLLAAALTLLSAFGATALITPQLLTPHFDGAFVITAAAALILIITAAQRPGHPLQTTDMVSVRTKSFAPYLPTIVAFTALTGVFIFSNYRSTTTAVLVAFLFSATLLRQFISTQEIHHLLQALVSREKQLEHQAQHDNLTGLENRIRFVKHVEEALRDNSPGAVQVAVVDLDSFGSINDLIGHVQADRVIVEVAQRLQDLNSGCLAVARLAADEFAILLARTDDPHTAGQRIVTAMHEPIKISGQTLNVTCSVGIATVAVSAVTKITGDQLMNQADRAMYMVKHTGRDGYRVHTQTGSTGRYNDRLLAPALAEAINTQALETVYQPIVASKDMRLIGFEALSRWTLHGKPVRPDIFIGVAERCAMIGSLTDLVIERACHQIATWNKMCEHRRLTIAVNLGGYCLRDRELPDRVMAAIAKHRIEPGQLRLEITESVPITDIENAYETLARFKDHGVLLSLDDFGTGYNSISQLLRLPVMMVKIERSLTSEIHHDPNGYRLVQGMFELAQHLGLGVVAEGVETPEQLSLLQHIGVDAVQGFLLGKPRAASTWTQAIQTGYLTPDNTAVPAQARPNFSIGQRATADTPQP